MSDYWCLTCGGRVGMTGHGIHNEDLIAKIDELVASGMKRPDAIEAVGKWQIGDKPEPMPAEATNETEYGPEIVVDGVRPEWLRDDEVILCNGERTVSSNLWAATSSIRLRADHPYYHVAAHNAKHGTQFKYWPGGDEAPGDWDGDEYGVLYRDGRTFGRRAQNWKHYGAGTNIIGYTPKPCADGLIGYAQEGSSERTVATPQPDFVPCERTLRMAIDALPFPSSNALYKSALRALLPKKDRAEELVEAFIATTENQIIATNHVRQFIAWAIAQGEIRG